MYLRLVPDWYRLPGLWTNECLLLENAGFSSCYWYHRLFERSSKRFLWLNDTGKRSSWIGYDTIKHEYKMWPVIYPYPSAAWVPGGERWYEVLPGKQGTHIRGYSCFGKQAESHVLRKDIKNQVQPIGITHEGRLLLLIRDGTEPGTEAFVSVDPDHASAPIHRYKVSLPGPGGLISVLLSPDGRQLLWHTEHSERNPRDPWMDLKSSLLRRAAPQSTRRLSAHFCQSGLQGEQFHQVAEAHLNVPNISELFLRPQFYPDGRSVTVDWKKHLYSVPLTK